MSDGDTLLWRNIKYGKGQRVRREKGRKRNVAIFNRGSRVRNAGEDMLGKQRFSGREDAGGKGLDTAAPHVDSTE